VEDGGSPSGGGDKFIVVDGLVQLEVEVGDNFVGSMSNEPTSSSFFNEKP